MYRIPTGLRLARFFSSRHICRKLIWLAKRKDKNIIVKFCFGQLLAYWLISEAKLRDIDRIVNQVIQVAVEQVETSNSWNL